MEVSEAVSEDAGTHEFYQIWKRGVYNVLPQSSLLTKSSSSLPPPPPASPIVQPLDVFKLLFIIGYILLTLREPEMPLGSISLCMGPALFQRNGCKAQYFRARGQDERETDNTPESMVSLAETAPCVARAIGICRTGFEISWKMPSPSGTHVSCPECSIKSPRRSSAV